MWISTRQTFREGDHGWDGYHRFIGIPSLKEIRTVDPSLNEFVDDRGGLRVLTFDDAEKALAALPKPQSERQYHLLELDVENEAPPTGRTGYRLLGCDLADETHTSSLLNCGPWTGRLTDFIPRLNQYGLLGYADAMLAQALLPSEWPDEAHAHVTVWALHEVARSTAP